MRRAFSLVTAIFVMVLIGTILALAFTLSSTTVKQTGDVYMREQARLLAKSAVEYEILRIMGANDFNTSNSTVPTTLH